MKFLRFLKNIGSSLLTALCFILLVIGIVGVAYLLLLVVGWVGFYWLHFPLNTHDQDSVNHPYFMTGIGVCSVTAVIGYSIYAIYHGIKTFCTWIKECWDKA